MLLHNSAQFSANGEIQLLCIIRAHKYFILGAHNIVCFQPQCGPIFTAVLCCALYKILYAELRMYMRGCVLFMCRCIILEQTEN